MKIDVNFEKNGHLMDMEEDLPNYIRFKHSFFINQNKYFYDNLVLEYPKIIIYDMQSIQTNEN